MIKFILYSIIVWNNIPEYNTWDVGYTKQILGKVGIKYLIKETINLPTVPLTDYLIRKGKREEIFDDSQYLKYNYYTLLAIYNTTKKEMKDCPLLQDNIIYLPDYETCCTICTFYEKRIEHLTNSLALSPGNYYTEPIYQYMDYYKVLKDKWELLRKITDPAWQITIRRKALKEYIELVGEYDFYTWKWPLPDIRLYKIIE